VTALDRFDPVVTSRLADRFPGLDLEQLAIEVEVFADTHAVRSREALLGSWAARAHRQGTHRPGPPTQPRTAPEGNSLSQRELHHRYRNHALLGLALIVRALAGATPRELATLLRDLRQTPEFAHLTTATADLLDTLDEWPADDPLSWLESLRPRVIAGVLVEASAAEGAAWDVPPPTLADEGGSWGFSP